MQRNEGYFELPGKQKLAPSEIDKSQIYRDQRIPSDLTSENRNIESNNNNNNNDNNNNVIQF